MEAFWRREILITLRIYSQHEQRISICRRVLRPYGAHLCAAVLRLQLHHRQQHRRSGGPGNDPLLVVAPMGAGDAGLDGFCTRETHW